MGTKTAPLLVALLLGGCQGYLTIWGEEAGAESPVEQALGPGERAPLEVDTTPTDSFVVGFPPTHPVLGTVTAPAGLSSLTVAGQPASVAEDGRFSVDVPVAPGLQLVEVTAVDAYELPSRRDGHVSLLVSDYRPGGELNPAAVAIGLDDALLAAVVEPAQAMLANIDIADALQGAGALGGDDMCTINVTGASNGDPQMSLFVGEGGSLVARVVVPNIRVSFTGTCSMLITSTSFTGTATTDFDIRIVIRPVDGEGCIAGFTNDTPVVDLPGFDLQVSGGSGLMGLLVPLIGEGMEESMAEQVETEAVTTVDAMLSAELSDLSIFTIDAPLDLLGFPAHLQLCLTDLDSHEGQLTAVVGARVTTPGGAVMTGPGAPYLAGAAGPDGGRPVDAPPGTLLLDTGFVSQLVYAAWEQGALEMPDVDEVEMSLLSLIMPELRDAYPTAETVSVSIEGHLPPLIAAAPADLGDVLIDIGNFHVLLGVNGEDIFRLGTQISVVLDLEASEGGLDALVTDIQSSVWLIEENGVDVDDQLLAEAVDMTIGTMAAELLGESMSFPMPDFGLPITISSITSQPDTGFVQVALR